MTKYIDRAVVLAEIERRINGLKDCHADTIEGYAGEISGLERLLSFLDTLEVKEVEEPNASDRGMAEEIIINLKRVEQDYRIDLTKEIEWVRNKAQKGE